MPFQEPPSRETTTPSPFLIGRDSRGRWVVRQQNGQCGGLFVDRASAVRFAMFENGRRADGIVIVAGGLEFDAQGGAEPHPHAA
ncbi:MAG: hypothetical protein JSR72_18955 [Proteobacteria bacterium]|nr:hypothetical protein [Pseudomonadota bacterium]